MADVLRGRKLALTVNLEGTFFTHRLGLARAAIARGMEVHAVGPFTPEGIARLRAEGVEAHAVTFSRGVGNPVFEARTLLELRRAFRRVRPDVVHCFGPKTIAYGGSAARSAGVAAIVSSVTGLGHSFIRNDLKGGLFRTIVLAGFQVAFHAPRARVIFQNLDDHAEIERRGVLRGVSWVLIRGSGVDTRRFARVPEPEGRPLVMLPSRMLREKGVVEFVDACRELRRRGVQARFVLVGDADAANPASLSDAELRAFEREGVVEWWGHRHDMHVALAEANVVVLPSYREGLPKVLLEAASVGRALVATDVPGCREIVTDGDNGLLCRVHDTPTLAAAIERLVADPALRRRMAERSRERAEREFAEERVHAQILAQYEAALGV